MNRAKIYGISIALLCLSIAFSYLIFLLRSTVSFGNAIDPVYHLFLFGPTIASLLLLLIGHEPILSTVALRKPQNISSIALAAVLLVIVVVSVTIIQYASGSIQPEYNPAFFHLFSIPFSPVAGASIWLMLLVIHAGFAEEFAWRGYLYSRVSSLPWLEQILLINTIWAIWHFPFMPFRQPQQYVLFWVQSLELGTVLVYLRLRTNSSVAPMIVHPITVFAIMLSSSAFFRVVSPEWAGWPNYTIAIVMLPVSVYYYVQGSRLSLRGGIACGDSAAPDSGKHDVHSMDLRFTPHGHA